MVRTIDEGRLAKRVREVVLNGRAYGRGMMALSLRLSFTFDSLEGLDFFFEFESIQFILVHTAHVGTNLLVELSRQFDGFIFTRWFEAIIPG